MQHTTYTIQRAALAFVLFLLLAASAAVAHADAPLALFGTPLSGASRADLRQALKQAGLAPKRVQDGYFCDEYNVDGQLKGAKELTVCYTDGDERFASAEYTFPSFMDVQQVQRVIDTVASKYGRPSALRGDVGLGNVTALWRQPQGMEIRVVRGWPDTTTYLDLIDLAANRKMKAQIEAEKNAATKQQAQKDSNAF